MKKTKKSPENESYLILSGYSEGIIYKVIYSEIKREWLEAILTKFPIYIRLGRQESREWDKSFEHLREPLEVHAYGKLIEIYPPAGRLITEAVCDWEGIEYLKQIRPHCLFDTCFPGNKQIRACLHFDPDIFGIKDWPKAFERDDVEVDFSHLSREVQSVAREKEWSKKDEQ